VVSNIRGDVHDLLLVERSGHLRLDDSADVRAVACRGHRHHLKKMAWKNMEATHTNS
jgi:hypothetical protein